MKLLLVSDTHGLFKALEDGFIHAKNYGCDAVFQLGDYGYWPKDTKKKSDFLNQVNILINRHDIPLYWLPGNHEDWNALEILEKEASGLFIEDGFGGFYSPKIHIWTWDGINYLSIGGAYSIDNKYRIRDVTWFPQESITPEDIEPLLNSFYKADVILSHDAPIDFFPPNSVSPMDQYNILMSRLNLQKALLSSDPKILVHGHCHIRHSYYVANTQCEGLDASGYGNGGVAYAVLDKTTFSEVK
jgi:predicted phosphodiesterase